MVKIEKSRGEIIDPLLEEHPVFAVIENFSVEGCIQRKHRIPVSKSLEQRRVDSSELVAVNIRVAVAVQLFDVV